VRGFDEINRKICKKEKKWLNGKKLKENLYDCRCSGKMNIETNRCGMDIMN